MAPNTRVGKALRAMKDLGIPTDTVKPRLKNLLKLYNWNWDLIEEDNYRTLADAIFEYADDKRREDKEKDTMECDGSEPCSKKIHLEQPEDQDTSTMENENTTLDLEANEVPQTSIVPKLVETRSCLKDKNAESCSHFLPAAFRNKGKDPISSGLALKVTKSSSEGASSALHSKQGGDGPGFDHILKAKRHNDCPGESFVVPKRKQSVHSVTREGSPCVPEDNKDGAPACNSGTTLFRNFVIASSPSGEVKISLNYDSAIGQPNFLAPNIDKVLKFVESKYLKSYKIVGSQFSVMKLLKDLCESYLELGSDFKDTSSIGIGRSLSGDCLPCTTGLNRKTLMIGDSGVDLIRKEGSCSEFSSSQSLAVSQKQPTSNGRKRPSRKMHDDITKGTEKVRIPLLDESGTEQLPKFNYIPENTVYQNAYIHFSLARIADDDCCSRCSRDCLSLCVPCECAHDTGGEFAYTSNGLLREEFLTKCISMNEEPQKHFQIYCIDCPLERAKNGNQTERCKGHLVRKFVKECWRRCGCDMQCGNRVVQRGITCKLQVFVTNEGKGWGLRSLQDLPKGAFVCEYVGEILTNMELYERNQQSGGNERHTYPVILDADWASERHLKDEDALCLDATFNGNVARFVNHRCSDANLLEIPVEVETPDRHYYHLAFFTKRKVDAMEELTWDYGIDFSDHSHPIKAFRCCCGSAFCRDVKERNQTSAFR